MSLKVWERMRKRVGSGDMWRGRVENEKKRESGRGWGEEKKSGRERESGLVRCFERRVGNGQRKWA